eukprot:150082_1
MCDCSPKKNPKCWLATNIICGLSLVIIGIVLISSDGENCVDTDDYNYYNCNDGSWADICSFYRCYECYRVLSSGYDPDKDGCAEYNGNPVLAGIILMSIGIVMLVCAGWIWHKRDPSVNENSNQQTILLSNKK